MKVVDGGGPTCWVGESGRTKCRKRILNFVELAHQGVELTVGDGRRIQHVIAPPRVIDPLAEIGVSLTRLRQGLRELDFCVARLNLFLAC